eukprot:s4234_g7.t1
MVQKSGSKASNRILSLSQLLQRPCVCRARVCLQQFGHCQSAVLAARESFQMLEPSLKVAALQDFFNVSSCQSSQKDRMVAAIRTTNSNSVESVPSAGDEMLVASDEEDFFLESSEQEGAKQAGGDEDFFASSSNDDKAATPKVLDMEIGNGKSEEWFRPSSDSDPESGVDVGHGKSESGICARQSSSKKRQPRRPVGTAEFLGKPVCIRALSRLLCIGTSTLQKMRRGEDVFAGRPARPKHPVFGFCLDGEAQAKWHAVVVFLWRIYHSSAEFLPNHFKLPAAQREAPFPDEGGDDSAEDFSQRYVSKVLHELDAYSADMNVMLLGPGNPDAPRRFLQHSTRTELYFEYVAYSEANGQEPASYSTFLRVANCVMKPGMRGSQLAYRKAGDHAQCDTCWQLKQEIRQAKGAKERESRNKAYVKHVLSQWLDRQCYWQHRSTSHAFFQQIIEMGDKLMHASIHASALTLIQDGMDQAKFRVPRLDPRLRASKLSQRMYRPVLHILCSWAHGAQMTFFVSHEDQPKDSVTSMEAVSRLLSDLANQYTTLPLTLHIQHDGTPREAKNQFFTAYLLLLTSLQVFRQTTISFLRPGHSHEDVDQVFSQVAAMMSHSSFSTPDDLLELLNCTCQSDNAGHAARLKKQKFQKIRASACMLDQAADWKSWVAVAGLKLKGLRFLAELN